MTNRFLRFLPACLALILASGVIPLGAQVEELPVITGVRINAADPQRSMIQSIGVRFDRNLSDSVTAESLKVRNLDTGALVDLSTATLIFDPRNNSANWMIDRDTGALLADGNYLGWIEVDTLLDPVQRDLRAAAGEPIDDFVFGFHQFTGDTDGDRDVDFRDASVLRESWLRDVNEDSYKSFLDLDLSDRVDEADRSDVETTYFTILPPAPGIHLFLRNDTGEDPADRVTGLYRAAFGSIDTGKAVTWQARLDDGTPLDITGLVTGGSGVLDSATIDQLNGRPLVPGSYALTVEALDEDGAILAADTLSFEFPGVARFAPRFVTEPSAGVALGQVQQAAPLNLATWSVERWSGGQGPASWVIAPDGLSVEQTINAAPSALISDQSFLNLRVTGTFRVDTGSDDDLMGFIFGYQNRGQFYLFDWKQSSQGSLGGSALEGMSIKRIDAAPDDLTEADFWWSNESRPNMTILAEPTGIGWKDFQDYQITLEFTPGRITVEVVEEGTLLRRLEVMDDTFSGGRFGFYNYSQDSVIYRGFAQESLNNIYFYDAEALDPEGGEVTYSLAQAPPGATVDAGNGSVIWQPDTPGTFPFSLLATDPDGLTDRQDFEVAITPVDEPPTVNLQKTAASVFPGEEVGLQVVARDDQQLFRVRLFINDLEVDLDASNSASVTFSEIGSVELKAIAIDSAEQVSEVTSFIRVLDPEAPPTDNLSQSPVAPPGQTQGTSDLRPLTSFQAPLSAADDPTRLIGTVDANGGTLSFWRLEWAPLATVDPTDLSSPGTLWQRLAGGTDEPEAAELTTIDPDNFPDEELVFRLRAENANGLGFIASLIFNPRSQGPSGGTGDLGGGGGIRPSVAFTAPSGPGDDLTSLRGTVDANGGSLRDWTLEYAPRRLVDLDNLSDPMVRWTLVRRDRTEESDALFATLEPATLPDEPLVFRLIAVNESELGALAWIVFNPSSASLAGPADTTGINPANAARPVVRIASPRNPGDDPSALVGSVLANGGTLERWIVDYALLADVNASDLNDPAVTWTELATGTGEISANPITPLDDPAFQNGRWVIRLRAFNTNGLGGLASTTLDTGDTSAPEVAFTSPEPESDITFLTEIRGSVEAGGGALASWTLEFASTDQVGLSNLNANADWIEIASGTSTGNDLLLGTIDPTNVRNGSYVLRLRAFNTNGRGFSDGLILHVCGETKLGNFRIVFEDLNLPLSDIPLRIVRTYDSLDSRRTTDFGPGWTLSIFEADISETVPDTGDSDLFATPFEIGTRVFITNPDGKRVGFTFNVRGPRNRFLFVDWEPYFIPDPGVEETLTIAPSDFQRVEVDAAGAVFTPLYPIGYNPDRYRLTTTDGTIYEYDQRAGLRRILDSNGNQLSFTRNAITHSDGTRVEITRDRSGRITAVTDPDGGAIRYEYDSRGRLRYVIDRTDGRTEFVYGSPRRPNFVTDIIDPRGVAAVRSEYNDEGRLIRQTDARGGTVQFGYDPETMTQTVTDRLGNVTLQEFDELGNVTRSVDREGAVTQVTYVPGTTRERFITDPVGDVTAKAYTANGNLAALTLGADPAEDPASPVTGSTLRFDYSPDNELTAITDPNGNVDRADYDPATGELIRFTSAANDGGDAVELSYLNSGEAGSIRDAVGNVTTYTHFVPGDAEFDPAGLTGVARIVDAVLRNSEGEVLRVIRTYENRRRNILRRVDRRTLPDGSEEAITTDYEYDAESQPVLTVRPNGRIEEVRSNSVGQITTILVWANRADYDRNDESLARVTRHEYDLAGNRIRTVHPDGATVSFAYDAEDRQISATDELGRVTRFEYDAEGRLRFTIHPDDTPENDSDNPRTENIYDAAGRRVEVIDEVGHRVESRYNSLDLETERLVHLDDGSTLVTRFEYDAEGNLVALIDPNGRRSETILDSRDRPVTMLHPATVEHGVTSSGKEYDALGRIRREIDEEGRGKQFTYDGMGRLTRVEFFDSAGTLLPDGRVDYAYDEVGNRISQTDAEGHVTRFEYDAMGRRTARILPDGSRETFAFDAFDNLVQRTDFAGFTTTYRYDRRNRLTEIVADPTHPSLALAHAPASIEISYLPDNRPADRTLFNASGDLLHRETFTYDQRGRLIEKATTSGTLTYSWTEDDLLASISSEQANGIDLSYEYDAAGRLVSVADQRSTFGGASYDYDQAGNLLETTYGNGISHRYSHDARNRLIALDVTDASEAPLAQFTYTLNPRGDRARAARADGRSHDYEYDDLYRLRSETITGGSSPGTLTYDFDRNGNRTSRGSTVAGLAPQSLSYNANNRLTSDTYDANGNTIESPLPAASVRGADLYDFRNRLIRRTRLDGTTIDFLYDADGIRIRKTVTPTEGNAEAVHFLGDDKNPTGHPQVIEERGGTGDLLAVHSYGHQRISTREIEPGPDLELLFLYDGSGSVVGLLDSVGSVVQSYSYDAFGNLLGAPTDLLTHFLYRGEQFDPDLGLYYLRARYAYPGTGRFWTMDRFQGFLDDPLSLHPYLYAHANPVSYADPSGYFSIAGIQVGFSIQFNLRKVQANHISKATKVIAKRMLKAAAIFAKHYLDFRGYTRFNLEPAAKATVFLPIGIDYHLTGTGRLIADLLYTQSLAMVKGAFAARLVSAIAGFFKVGPKGVKIKIGRFTTTLHRVISAVKSIGSAVGGVISSVLHRSALFRLIKNAREVYQVFQNMRSVTETAAEFAPLAQMAFDYWQLNRHAARGL